MTNTSSGPGTQPKRPGLFAVVGSVLAAMFGVQSTKRRERDFTHGRPWHYIVAGLVLTAAFIATLVTIVQWVLP